MGSYLGHVFENDILTIWDTDSNTVELFASDVGAYSLTYRYRNQPELPAPLLSPPGGMAQSSELGDYDGEIFLTTGEYRASLWGWGIPTVPGEDIRKMRRVWPVMGRR